MSSNPPLQQIPRQSAPKLKVEVEVEVKSLWGEYCMMCNNDWWWPESCDHCRDSYDKLKAQGKLPRRREAILATKEKLSNGKHMDTRTRHHISKRNYS